MGLPLKQYIVNKLENNKKPIECYPCKMYLWTFIFLYIIIKTYPTYNLNLNLNLISLIILGVLVTYF